MLWIENWTCHFELFQDQSFFFINFYWSIGTLQYCQFLLYRKMKHSYIYIYPLTFGFPSQSGYHSAFSRVSQAIQYIIFIHNISSVYVLISISHFLPTLFSFGIHTFLIYTRVSISALQTRSPIPFFQIPHICVNMWYLFFSFWLTSLLLHSLGPSIFLQVTQFHSFLWLSNILLYICILVSLSRPLLMDI